jgi:uncharacterized iron-regulated protein
MAAVSRKSQNRIEKEGSTLSNASFLRICLLCLVFSCLAGCASLGGIVPHPAPRPQSLRLAVGDIIETATGKVISMDELVDRLAGASIVYVGEMHTSTWDHKTQLTILRKLHDKGQCTEMGMEMFPRSAQPVLDRYVRKEITEEEFLKEVHWDEVWGFPFPLYRGLLDFARNHGMPVLGLNAPHPVVSKIAKSGLESLSTVEREQVAREFHLNDAANRTRMQREYRMHGKESIKDFETFFEAQLAWEETMAETLAARLQESDVKCRIVVIIGKGHISDRLGVPYLASLRKKHEYKTVAPVPVDYPFSVSDPDLADYVVITDKAESPHPPRLGVTIQATESGKGVEVLEVMPGSPAAGSGLKKGDIILSVNAKPVSKVEEVQKAVAEGGSSLKILIKREGKRIVIDVKMR